MRKLVHGVLSLSVCSLFSTATAQSVGIGTNSPTSSAQLEVSSSTQGLLIPRMNLAGITAITSPAKGLMVYDSVHNQLMINMGTSIAPDWENIVAGQGWSFTGVHGLPGTTQFLGTTDAIPLTFRIGGQAAGMIDSATENTYFGYLAGAQDSPPFLGSLATGKGNTGVGAVTMGNSNSGGAFTAIDNVSLGNNALSILTSGSNDVGVGFRALELNSIGINNIGLGGQAISQLHALNGVTNYQDNIGIGVASGNQLIDESGNIVIGNNAFSPNVGATSNPVFTLNTIIGAATIKHNSLGKGNVVVGTNGDITLINATNVVAIGDGVVVAGSNQVRIGNTATKSIGGFADWTSLSDGRVKKDLRENVAGIDFIMRLRPITYHLDIAGIQQKISPSENKAEHPDLVKSRAERLQTVFSGFTAQEVEKAAQDAGYTFSGVEKPADENGFYGLRYAEFVVPLVKAAQEQQHAIEAMRKKIEQLEQKIQKH